MPHTLLRFSRAPKFPWRVALLVLAACLVWVAHFDRWTAESWRVPTDYTGDAHETLARLKASSEGELVPLAPEVIDRLGAPFGAHWNAYPTPDKPLMLALGALVHVIGLYATANLGYLLAQLSAALAFYFVARWFRCRWPWAAAGALLFAYTYHTFHRGLAHFSLIFTWTVPLGLLAAWLVAKSRRLAWGRREAALCLLSGLALGLSNPYNLFFWLQLMGWSLLVQLSGPRRRENLQVGLATVAIAVAAFFVVNAEVWLHDADPAAVPLLARNYGGTERYALKPVEMFIPPEFHRWSWLAFFGHRYVRWSEWRGEVFLPYLGLVGIAGFIWLAIVTIRALLRRRSVPGQALTMSWLLAYASIGGVTNILAFFIGLQVFRATNRVAIFISAIVLLFLVIRLSRLSLRWPPWLAAGAAVALTVVGVLDQVPRPDPAADVKAMADMVHADEQFGRALDGALPHGAMVFQLPVMGFPEVVPPWRLDSYEEFRPYFTTDHVRFSYGTPKLRSRIRWEREVERLPPDQLVHTLEQYGFAALYVNRKGYRDGADRLLQRLDALGYHHRISTALGQQVAVLLHPAPTPLLPLAHSFALGSGWLNAPDGKTRWAYDDAALSYFNPYPHAVTVDLSLNLRAVAPRTVELLLEGKLVRKMLVSDAARAVTVTGVRVQPGVNHFKLRSNAPPVRLSAGTNQLRSFGLQSSAVHVVPALDPLPPAAALAAQEP